MTFEFNYSKQLEIDRLIFVSKRIVDGTYTKLGFLLLENIIEDNKIPTVIVPSINKIKLTQSVIKNLLKATVNTGLYTEDLALQKTFSRIFADIEILDKTQVFELESRWKSVEKPFVQLIDVIFPDNILKNIVIIPTKYGTMGSYHAEKDKLFIVVRIDQTAEYITSLIVRAIVQYSILQIEPEHGNYTRNNETWNKKEKFTDSLILYTGLKKLCPDYRSTLKMLENHEIDTTLVKISNGNYQKIGFPVTKALKLNGLIIKIHDEKLEGLTKTQNGILLYFLQNESEIVKIKKIAEIMWGEDYYEKYSLSAMAKMIHQLRQKLKSAGLQKEVIFTKRGKGYVLVQ